jgi:hypothetical protein
MGSVFIEESFIAGYPNFPADIFRQHQSYPLEEGLFWKEP